VSVRVFDATGRLVAAPWTAQARPAGPQTLGLDVRDWPAGHYTLLVETPFGQARGRLVRVP
jgi:hypothetical protein